MSQSGGGRRFRRLLSLYRGQGCVKQLPQEYRMIDTRKKQLYQPAPLFAGHVSIDLEVKKKRTEYRKQIY